MSSAERRSPDRAFVDQAVERCLARGFDAAQVRVVDQQLHELQADFGNPALLRTVRDADVSLTGLIDGKKGSLSLNRKDEASLAAAVSELWEIATGSLADEANVIADHQPPQSFVFGPTEPDYDAMFASLNQFLVYTGNNYPLITLGSANVSFNGQAQAFGNSNGLRMDCVSAQYAGSAMFTAREGEDVSSFNHCGFNATDLSLPFSERATTDEMLRQTSEQVRTRKVPEQFTGSLIITPDALSDFIGFLLSKIGNGPLIAGTSIYRDKLGESVAAAGLTIRSCPLTLPAGYRFTADGLPVEDTVIVEDGILKSYLLNLYGSKKTGLPLSGTAGGCLVVDPGSSTLADMIASTRQGVLITRFSGGVPNDRGDFSGVAKNSYYVADGQVRYPISETMISGNLAELLQSVDAISAERADFGWSRLPWIRAQDIGVS